MLTSYLDPPEPINWNTLYLGIAGVMKDNRSRLFRLPSKLHYHRHETLRFPIKSIAIEREIAPLLVTQDECAFRSDEADLMCRLDFGLNQS